MNKEKIIEEFRYDYYQTGKLTYTEEDGSTRANPENIIDWWLSKFDSHTEELKKKIEGKRKESEKFVPFQKIHYQSALDDIISELNHQ